MLAFDSAVPKSMQMRVRALEWCSPSSMAAAYWNFAFWKPPLTPALWKTREQKRSKRRWRQRVRTPRR
jgi:hypothetical protein